MRICSLQLQESLIPTIAPVFSDIKSRVDQAAQHIFSNIIFLWQYLTGLHVNTWALLSGTSVGASVGYLIFSNKTPLKFGLLISVSILKIVLLYSAIQKADAVEKANKNFLLLKIVYREFLTLKLSQMEEIEELLATSQQRVHDVMAQWKEQIVRLQKVHKSIINSVQEEGIESEELKPTPPQTDEIDCSLSVISCELEAEDKQLQERFSNLNVDLRHYPTLPQTVGQTIENIPGWIESQKFELVSKEALKSIQEIQDAIKLCQEHHSRVKEAHAAYFQDTEVHISNIGKVEF